MISLRRGDTSATAGKGPAQRPHAGAQRRVGVGPGVARHRPLRRSARSRRPGWCVAAAGGRGLAGALALLPLAPLSPGGPLRPGRPASPWKSLEQSVSRPPDAGNRAGRALEGWAPPAMRGNHQRGLGRAVLPVLPRPGSQEGGRRTPTAPRAFQRGRREVWEGTGLCCRGHQGRAEPGHRVLSWPPTAMVSGRASVAPV